MPLVRQIRQDVRSIRRDRSLCVDAAHASAAEWVGRQFPSWLVGEYFLSAALARDPLLLDSC